MARTIRLIHRWLAPVFILLMIAVLSTQGSAVGQTLQRVQQLLILGFALSGAVMFVQKHLAYIIQVQAAAWYVKFTDRIFGRVTEPALAVRPAKAGQAPLSQASSPTGSSKRLAAETFKRHSPLLVASPTVFLPGLHAQDEEIAQLLNGSAQHVPEEEASALLYARLWAEASGQPAPELRTQLVERYGEAQAAAIERVLSTIWVGNLLGNTWDALLFRLSGGRLGDERS